MALSGSFNGTCTGNYPQGYRFWCEWVVNSQSAMNCQSNVTVTFKVQRIDGLIGAWNVDAVNPVNMVINGTTVVNTRVPIDTRNGQVCTLCSYTGTFNHNTTTGALSLSISGGFTLMVTNVSLRSGSISGTASINSVDRSAPSVSASVSNVDVSTAKLSASSNVPCDVWEYTLNNGGSWSRFSTASVTSVSCNLTGLSAYTDYSIKVRARKTSNRVYGTSAAAAFKTQGQSRITSTYPVQIDAESPVITYDVTVYASFSHKIALLAGDTSLIEEYDVTLPVGSTTQQIVLTSAQRGSILSHMAENKTLTASLVLKTYSGSAQIGQSSVANVNLNTSAQNSAPIFTSYTYEDVNSACVAVTGNAQVIVRNQSDLKITVGPVTVKNEASVASYRAVVGKNTYTSATNEITVGAVDLRGNLSVVVTVIDSRGYECSVTQEISVMNYEPPSIVSSQVRRVNEVDATVELSFSGDFTSLSIEGVSKNSIVLAQYRTKQTSAEAWGEWTTITVQQSYGSFSFETENLTSLDADYSFNFEVQVTDEFSSDTEALVLPQGKPLMSFKSKKVGINVPTPQAALDLEGGLRIDGKNFLDYLHPIGSIYMSTNTANPSDLFGGEWEAYAQGRVIVGVGNNGETEYTLGITGGKDIIKNTHNHYTTMSYDGAGLYSNQSSNAPRSRTKNSSNRACTYPDEKGSGITREDSTYDETLTLDVRQPYISCYIWRRIA